MNQQTIESFLEDLGAKQPTPGGGAASALTAAQGAALIEMVARFSLGKKGSGNATIDWDAIAAEMAAHRRTFLDLAERDQAAFARVMDCYKREDSDPDKATALEEALVGAAEPPLQTIELAWKILGSLEPWVQKANAHVISDAGIAVAHLQAAIASSEFNVAINTKFMRNEQQSSSLRDRLRAVTDVYQSECEKLRQLVHQRI